MPYTDTDKETIQKQSTHNANQNIYDDDDDDIFLTSALVGGEWSASHPSRFTLGERAPRGTHWIARAPESVLTTWRRENPCPYRDSNSDPSVVQPVGSCYTD
jgi:hypothetical protein